MLNREANISEYSVVLHNLYHYEITLEKNLNNSIIIIIIKRDNI